MSSISCSTVQYSAVVQMKTMLNRCTYIQLLSTVLREMLNIATDITPQSSIPRLKVHRQQFNLGLGSSVQICLAMTALPMYVFITSTRLVVSGTCISPTTHEHDTLQSLLSNSNDVDDETFVVKASHCLSYHFYCHVHTYVHTYVCTYICMCIWIAQKYPIERHAEVRISDTNPCYSACLSPVLHVYACTYTFTPTRWHISHTTYHQQLSYIAPSPPPLPPTPTVHSMHNAEINCR